MRYTLLLHYPERPADQISEDEMKAGMSTFDKWAKEIHNAGALVSAEMFQRSPETTTVKIIGETIEVIDGPAHAGGDQLGGIVVLEVAEHGDALYWAKHAPSIAWGPVELRAAMVEFRDGEWHPVAPPPVVE